MIQLEKQFAKWITDRQLLRLQLTRDGQKRTMSVRLLQFQEDKQLLLFYHEDEKQVYNLYIHEIEQVEEV